ncbi:hypothetical protein HZS61_008221 [Fusarium oxysporum f. sp. conglutinans]|nr:hypothetical protein HZS61_008221 [Fusarium oxysporum f. sp. conglutinans]KAG6999987.1 hypothetical protein FocnCong_v013046 [Fusarium oxysporum f. sp. conglutinans]KAG7000056.1 hypothetical protein FocnCong_v012991 [Fusarium oxysporum f. sp. conglutinans]KAH7465314.1 hypothetical protein FOMA001_g16992 [Fusarium oxysporum f. sp. matthiolae]KAI8417000.1 hypothetical protein FOFC_03313 [Fusarium oxysporum]
MDPATPATPVNKRKTPHNAIDIDGLGEDTEITPRPGKAPSAGPGSTASSVMRDAPSLTSQSDTSQKSGRSSPVKTFPIIGMEGHVIYSKPLDPDDHALPPELVDLLCDLDTINDKAGIIPKSLKAEIERQDQPDMTLKWIRRSSHIYAPDDEFGLIPGCLITAKNHLSRVKMLVEFAKRARELGFDETMWNNEVHTPTLQFAFRGDQWLDHALVDSLSCMNASPRADYYKFPIPLSRVDYTLFINPAVDKDTRVREAIGSLSAALGGFINHTTSGSFSSFPLALSIETKRYGGDQRKADVQTATWHASQWTFLQSLAGDKISELPFLPGIVVHAHEWKFVATSRKGNETILWSSCPIGSAITTVGVFQILAGLRRLRKWCEEVYWPWYKKNILQLGEDTG